MKILWPGRKIQMAKTGYLRDAVDPRIGTNFFLCPILVEYYHFDDVNQGRESNSPSWSLLSKAETYY